jgi:hypothetical protein
MSREKSKFLLFFLDFLRKFRYSNDMFADGLTINEMAEMLDLPRNTVVQRLHVAGIKPITKEAIYDKSALEAIRSVPGKGRPPKAKPEPQAKPKKGKK